MNTQSENTIPHDVCLHTDIYVACVRESEQNISANSLLYLYMRPYEIHSIVFVYAVPNFVIPEKYIFRLSTSSYQDLRD